MWVYWQREYISWHTGQWSVLVNWVKWGCSLKMGYYIRGSCILMRWLYGLDLGDGLDDIGIESVCQHDTLTRRSSKLLKSIIYEHFWGVLMIINSSLIIDLNVSEPHNVKFLFLQTLSIVQLFDFLTSYKILEIHLNIYSTYMMSSVNVSHSAS